MRRSFLIVDWLIWIGPPVLVTGLAIGAWLTPQDWPVAKIAVLATTVWMFWVVGALAMWHRLKAQPTFTLACGADVWTNGLKAITKEACERAVNAVCERLPVMLPNHRLEPEGLRVMFGQARIEFVRLPYLLGDQRVAGHQRGNYMRVAWLGGFQHNAFVHESIHMIHEVVLRMNPDYDHQLFGWWQRGDEIREGLG